MRTMRTACLACLTISAACSGGGNGFLSDDPEAVQEERARSAVTEHVARAEAAGNKRDALAHYVAALAAIPPGEITAAEFDVRARAIRLVGSMDPAPAVPPEAQQHFAIGEAAAKAATNEVAYDRAVTDFVKGLGVAPWDAQANYNVGLLYDLQKKIDPALRWLKLYTMAAPSAPDLQAVQRKIADLELRKRSSGVEGLVGTWRIYASKEGSDPRNLPIVGGANDDFHYVCEAHPSKRNHVLFYRVASRDLAHWTPPISRGSRELYKQGTPINSVMRLEGRNLIPICRWHDDCTFFESEERNAKGSGLVSEDWKEIDFKLHPWKHRNLEPKSDYMKYYVQRKVLRKE